MTNVVSLGGSTPSTVGEPQSGVIELLQEMLHRAESGNIQHVAMAIIDHTGTPLDAHALGSGAQCAEAVMLIGAIEMGKSVIIERLNETS